MAAGLDDASGRGLVDNGVRGVCRCFSLTALLLLSASSYMSAESALRTAVPWMYSKHTCFMMASAPIPPAPCSTLCRRAVSPLGRPASDAKFGDPFVPTFPILLGDPTPTLPLLPFDIRLACPTRGDRDGPASGCGRADIGRLLLEPVGEAAAALEVALALTRGEAVEPVPAPMAGAGLGMAGEPARGASAGVLST